MQDRMTLAKFRYPDGSEMIRSTVARTFHNASVCRANLARGLFNILMSNGKLVGTSLPTVGSACTARSFRF